MPTADFISDKMFRGVLVWPVVCMVYGLFVVALVGGKMRRSRANLKLRYIGVRVHVVQPTAGLASCLGLWWLTSLSLHLSVHQRLRLHCVNMCGTGTCGLKDDY